MKAKEEYPEMKRFLEATDSRAIPADLPAEERIRMLEAQNFLLRFHYTALAEYASKSSAETQLKKNA